MMFNYFMLFSALCTLQIHAFWWPATTTEAPKTSTTTVLKEIPLTYFRTYTYQPMAGNPFSFPFSFGFGAAQTPLLGSARYDPYVSSYPPATYAGSTNDVPIPIINMAHMMRPASVIGSSSNSVSASKTTTSTTTPRPPPPPKPKTTTTTTTTTSTTTTTPPPPPPPPVTTTTTTSTTTSRPVTPPARGLVVESPLSDYSNYNRRVYQVSNDGYSGSYYMRPQHPYPDYFNYQPQQQQPQQQQQQQPQQQQQQQNLLFQNPSALSSKSNSRIQFVPCMCPVSVSLTANGIGSYDSRSASIVGSPIIALSEGTVQARSDDEDDDIDDEIDELSEVVRQHFTEPVVNTASSVPLTQVPYPVPAAYVNPTATTLSSSSSSSLSATKSGLSLTSALSPSSLSKIIIEALPTIPSASSTMTSTQASSSTHDPKEFMNEQVAPEDIIVLTAETEADNESTHS